MLKKQLLIIIFILSILITWYKYYYFLFQKNNLENIFKKSDIEKQWENNIAFSDIVEDLTLEDYKITSNYKISNVNDWYFYYKMDKIFTNSFFNEFPNIKSKFLNWEKYDFSCIEKDWEKQLIFLTLSDYTKSKETSKSLTIEMLNKSLSEKIKENKFFITLNTQIIDLNNNSEKIEKNYILINQLNNLNENSIKPQQILMLETDKLKDQYVLNLYIKQNSYNEKIKIEKFEKKVWEEIEKYKKDLSDLDYFYSKNKEKEIKDLFQKYNIDYYDLYSYQRNKNSFMESFNKHLKEKINEYETLFWIY